MKIILFLKEFFMGNKVEICGVDTSKIPVLTPEEKTELFIRIQNGDEEARNIFINGNLRLVKLMNGCIGRIV